MLEDEYKGEYEASDTRAWREGDWLFASLRGRLVGKRLTRDRSFVTAAFAFNSWRSPRLPRIDGYFTGVEFLKTSKKNTPPGRVFGDYSTLYAPIETSR